MYTHAFAGGTFDGIHKGHQAFLSKAFNVANQVTIGITSDAFAAQLKPGVVIRPYDQRKQDLTTWIADNGWQDKATLIMIEDAHEPVASETVLDCLMVTVDTKARGEEINQRRMQKGLIPLTLIDVPLVSADDGKPISSTRVRGGEIDTSGHLVMPDTLRPVLAKPLGIVVVNDQVPEIIDAHRNNIIMSVGDITTTVFIDSGVVPSLSIIDLLVGRKPHNTMEYFNNIPNVSMMSIKSGPGYISQSAVDAIRGWTPSERKRLIVVDGEEDLLTLPAVVYGPLGAFVFYGQPNEGMVMVEITPEKKKELSALLSQFTD